MKRFIVLFLSLCLITALTACTFKGAETNPVSQNGLVSGEKLMVKAEPESRALSQDTAERMDTRRLPGNISEAAVKEWAAGLKLPKSEVRTMGAFDFKTKTVMLNSGYRMPIMGLGAYSLTNRQCAVSIAALLQAGGRLIDTAYMYSNEAAVGQAIRDSHVPRKEIFVITKLYPSQFDRAAEAIDEALKRMGLDYIDMILLHHPGDGDVEAYRALEQAAAAGKVRSIGLSNWYVEELERFLPQVNIMPALVQNEIHPYYQENNVIPYIQALGIVVQSWYPLGGRGYTAELLGDKAIAAIAKKYGVSSAQVILRWNLQKGVVVIPGSSKPEHILENLDLFGFELTAEEMAQITLWIGMKSMTGIKIYCLNIKKGRGFSCK